MRSTFLKFVAVLTYIKLCPLRAWPFVIPGTWFVKNCISLSQGCSMPNIKALRSMIHEKEMFEDLSKVSLWFLSSLVEIGQVVSEKKSKMWKINRRRTDVDQNSSLEPFRLRWANNARILVRSFLTSASETRQW